VPSLPRSLATGSQQDAAQAAAAMLTRHGAVDAVVAGVFAAAATSPAVLLGPVQILLAGAGTGLRAVDGRTVQPGKGNARPRGFRPGDAIPPAARVAVPSLPSALAVTLATFGSVQLTRAVGPAVDLAKACSPARAAVLERIGARGPQLVAGGVGGELVNAVGPLAGGILSLDDLEDLRPGLVVTEPEALGARRAVVVPWDGAAIRKGSARGIDASHTQVVLAVDARGTWAIAAYEAPEDGVAIPELGLVAPFGAEPVLRGEARVKPGTPRPAAAPIALIEADRVTALAVGIAELHSAEATLGRWLTEADPMDSPAPTDGRALGVVRTDAGVAPIRRAL
jgi:hypothetical protein